jgi:EAL domain-containing protein (putative c-di-GMP-specific phosphodiesterase class I)
VVDQTTMSTPGVSHPSPTTAEDLRRVLDERAARPVFQPVADLDNRHVLGYEALASGPMGSALASPATRPGCWPPSPRPARPAGAVAVDDVGAAPASLAVLPFVRPDLIKLDMRPLRGRTTAEAAHIVTSVRAHAERTDAVVLAEGIESIKHAREAVAAGATPGQGILFDDPLRREWDLVVIGPRFAAALVARDRGDRGPEERRRFDVVVTHDRDLVIRAAEPLRRLVPER